MRLTDSGLSLIRDTKAHYTDLYLSIFQPNTVLQARVNEVGIAKGDRNITYDTVTLGSWQNVRVGSTLLVGSSIGARDIGKIRIKSITSSVITVAENQHIEWADNQFLTVLDYFDIWPIFPRMIQNPSNAEQVIWYKDYDILYTDQNVKLGAFMNIGPHRAAFIENGSAPLYFSASGSYPLSGGAIGNKVWWEFQSGTPSTYQGMTPGYVNWGVPGDYLVSCVMSGTNGWGETGYRYASIYDKPSEGTNVPTLKWEISSLQGSRGEAGYNTSIAVYEEVEVQEGSIVVIFADEWYDGTRVSLGGNAPNAGAIKFVGYVLDNSIRYNYKDSFVTFEVASITEVMKNLEGFSVSVESKVTPTDWYELKDMNAKSAVYHYLKWHSNIISLADIEFIGNDFPVQFFDSDRESMFDAVDNFLRTTYHATVVADRQGKLYLETDAWVRPNATGTYNPIFVLSKYDWLDEPDITERRYPELSYIEYGGIAYSGPSTGTFRPLLSDAPGSAPAYRGKSEKHSGFALEGQTQLNELVGNEFYHRNFEFPAITLPMRGNWSNLDIAPQEVVQFNILASDTVRNVVVNGIYQPAGIAWAINSRNKTFMPRVTWNAITTGPSGETIPIPELPDDGGYGGGGGIGSITIPSFPISTGTFAGSFIQTRFGPILAKPAGELPNFVVLPLVATAQSSNGLYLVASGTYSGVSGSQSIYIQQSGYYRISMSGKTICNNSADVDDSVLSILIDGAVPDSADAPRLGNSVNDGNSNFVSFGDSGGFSFIKLLNAGQQISAAFAMVDDPLLNTPYSVSGWLSLEFVST